MKKIMKYKKTAIWIVGIAVVLCVVIGIGVLTDRVSGDGKKDTETEEYNVTESEEETEEGKETGTEIGTQSGTEETSETECEEIIIYETSADLTHDGIEDKIQTVFYSYGGDKEFGSTRNGMRLKMFQGNAEGGFEQEASYMSEMYSRSHASNGTMILTESDGKDYLMFSSMYEHQGWATYEYSVMYIGKEMQTVVVEEDSVQFSLNEFGGLWKEYDNSLRKDVVPGLREKMEPWIQKGITLFALDILTTAYASSNEYICPAHIYYSDVWNRSNEVVFATHISYKEAYSVVLNYILEKYSKYTDEILFSLVHFDEDDTPELLVGLPGRETSMYTYHEGRICPLMKQWELGVAGNRGYLYMPGENILFYENSDDADEMNNINFYKIDENYQFINYDDESLKNSLTELYGDFIPLCPDKSLSEIREELKN